MADDRLCIFCPSPSILLLRWYASFICYPYSIFCLFTCLLPFCLPTSCPYHLLLSISCSSLISLLSCPIALPFHFAISHLSCMFTSPILCCPPRLCLIFLLFSKLFPHCALPPGLKTYNSLCINSHQVQLPPHACYLLQKVNLWVWVWVVPHQPIQNWYPFLAKTHTHTLMYPDICLQADNIRHIVPECVINGINQGSAFYQGWINISTLIGISSLQIDHGNSLSVCCLVEQYNTKFLQSNLCFRRLYYSGYHSTQALLYPWVWVHMGMGMAYCYSCAQVNKSNKSSQI